MIDEFTFKDLALDDVVNKYRDCKTTAGDEYFIDRLVNPFSESEKDFFKLVKYYESTVKQDNEYAPAALKRLGKFKFSDFKGGVEKMTSKEAESNVFHYFVICIVLISFALIFVFPGPGFLSFLVAVAVALFSYFSKSKELSVQFFVYKYIIRLLRAVDNSYIINKEPLDNKELFDEMKTIRSVFSNYLHGQFIIKTNESTDGNPIDVFLDYVRMIFHLDIIKYNRMHHVLCSNKEQILRLYQIIGMIDVAVLVNRLKLSGNVCEIQYIEDNVFVFEDGYHPLVKNPVVNSLNTKGNILVTGCNASGKSTYLKMAGIIAVWGEAFGYTFAKSCVMNRFNVLSSMAIKDSLETGESYFTAELNSIKRIIELSDKGVPVFCIIDEILRGTNTVERIAASSEILSSLVKNNVICLAATHDIELTKLLSETYTNMHFSEDITENDVIFSYKIKNGPSETRNAIRLLSIMGYDSKIVTNAEKRANNFISSGMWV